MLNLTRKLDQVIVIVLPTGEECRVQVRRIEQGRVMLGLDFPRDWIIHREEVLYRENHGDRNHRDPAPVESS